MAIAVQGAKPGVDLPARSAEGWEAFPDLAAQIVLTLQSQGWKQLDDAANRRMVQ